MRPSTGGPPNPTGDERCAAQGTAPQRCAAACRCTTDRIVGHALVRGGAARRRSARVRAPVCRKYAVSGLYEVSVPVFARMLRNLSALLDRMVADLEPRKVDPAVLLQSRLYPDMFPLLQQVQLACDFAKGASARLAGVPVPAFPDEEKTVDELQARIAKVVAFVESVAQADVDAGAARDVSIKLRDRTVELKGLQYFNHMAMPNFYFHCTTAYAIMRHNGVAIGKTDFVGR